MQARDARFVARAGATIVWLAGMAPDAVTGATVPVDGGLSL